MSQTLTSHLSLQSQQPRTSPRQDDRDCLKGGEQCVREGSAPGLAAVILPCPPWQSCSREQQAAHLVWELQRGGRWGGAAPHRPAINHSYVAKGQGVGRGQGAAAAAHTGQGREARVRCSCKSSPKCFQGKANQGSVTEHTQPHQAPAVTLTPVQAHIHSQIQKYIWTCSAYSVVHAEVSHHTWIHKDTCAHQTCCHVCMCSHTHTERQFCTHAGSFRPSDTKIYLIHLTVCTLACARARSWAYKAVGRL